MKTKSMRQPARPGSPWYTVADLQRLYDISERTVSAWVAIGRLPEPKKKGKRWVRWPKAQIDAMLAAEGCPPAEGSEVAA